MNLWLSNFNNSFVKPPDSVWAWMQTKTSITAKAKATCKIIRLELLDERWEKKEDKSVFIREINMYCNEQPGWYARTVIPKKTFNLRAMQFEHLKKKPLATILYNDPHIKREEFFYAYLEPSTTEYQLAMKHYPSHSISPTHLWARKSIFMIEKEPLYLTEVFFPDMFEKNYE